MSAGARVLGFDLWLEEVGRKRPSKVFVRIRGSKNIMSGETYVMAVKILYRGKNCLGE